jgi:hypothetical protein
MVVKSESMTRRLALTPVIGLFTGLSMVSFGAVSMWLTGVHGSPATVKNPCSAKSTAAYGTAANGTPAHTAAYTRPAYARHVAHLPVSLDAFAVRQSGHPATKTSSPTPDPTAPSPPQPSPGGNATPTPGGGGNPNPGSTPNSHPSKRPRSKPPIAPGGTNVKPPPTASPTPTITPTPTSTATPPPGGTLCLSVQTLGSGNSVKVHDRVQFAIWVWLTGGKGGSAKVTLSASPKDVAPTFTICQPAGSSTCSVSGLKGGQKVQVQAELAVPKDRAGKSVTLDVTGTSKQAGNSASASDTVQVKSQTSSSPTPTPTPTTGGGGNTLPAGTGGGVPPGNSFPSGGSTPGNLGGAFPQVSPSPNVSPTTAHHHLQQQPKAIDLSAGLPLDVRLIGGQVIGLAILAAAVTIAVARLSLRKQPARHTDDSSGSGSGS